MRWPWYLPRLCGRVGVWACGIEEESVGDVAGSVRFEELSSRRRLGLESRYVSVWLEMFSAVRHRMVQVADVHRITTCIIIGVFMTPHKPKNQNFVYARLQTTRLPY